MNHKSSLPILLAFLSATASTGLAEQSVQELKIGEKRQEITLGKRKKIKIPATAHQAPENLTLSNKFNAPPNCVVQDNGDIVVGISKLDDGSICGDVDFDAVKQIASAITPVPNGVGPMTIASLMGNIVSACKNPKST